MDSPVLENERYKLFISSGEAKEKKEWEGEYDSFLYTVYWWESKVAIVDKAKDREIHFS